jgi:hypothetical protein
VALLQAILQRDGYIAIITNGSEIRVRYYLSQAGLSQELLNRIEIKAANKTKVDTLFKVNAIRNLAKDRFKDAVKHYFYDDRKIFVDAVNDLKNEFTAGKNLEVHKVDPDPQYIKHLQHIANLYNLEIPELGTKRSQVTSITSPLLRVTTKQRPDTKQNLEIPELSTKRSQVTSITSPLLRVTTKQPDIKQNLKNIKSDLEKKSAYQNLLKRKNHNAKGTLIQQYLAGIESAGSIETLQHVVDKVPENMLQNTGCGFYTWRIFFWHKGQSTTHDYAIELKEQLNDIIKNYP